MDKDKSGNQSDDSLEAFYQSQQIQIFGTFLSVIGDILDAAGDWLQLVGQKWNTQISIQQQIQQDQTNQQFEDKLNELENEIKILKKKLEDK